MYGFCLHLVTRSVTDRKDFLFYVSQTNARDFISNYILLDHYIECFISKRIMRCTRFLHLTNRLFFRACVASRCYDSHLHATNRARQENTVRAHLSFGRSKQNCVDIGTFCASIHFRIFRFWCDSVSKLKWEREGTFNFILHELNDYQLTRNAVSSSLRRHATRLFGVSFFHFLF